MRYKISPPLTAEFNKSKEVLLANLKPNDCESDEEITQMIIGYFELGFNEGCKASGVYSDSLKELFNTIEV